MSFDISLDIVEDGVNMGDHAETITRAVDTASIMEMTVGELLEKLLVDRRTSMEKRPNPAKMIIIRPLVKIDDLYF